MEYKTDEYKGIKYIIRYPDNYNTTEKYPVILFMHGAGSRGEDINNVRDNPFFLITEKHKEFPFVTIAPLCNKDNWFMLLSELQEFAQYITRFEFTNKDRIYAMGTSMGGYAVWQLAMNLPELFAAIVPICGGGMYWNAGRLVNIPVWAFHGAKDTVVCKDESSKMVDAVNKCSGNAKLTIYPENGHDAWSDTYSNLEVFDWLLANTNKNDDEMIDEFKGGNIYG